MQAQKRRSEERRFRIWGNGKDLEKLLFIVATAAVTAAVATGARTAPTVGATDAFSAALLGFVNVKSGTANDDQDHSDENEINHMLTSFH